jgi:hypothetical protein
MLGLLFVMCLSHHAFETRLHEERKAWKKLQRDMKEVKKALYPSKLPSPPGSKEIESNPPTLFEQRYARYESLDPSQPLAPYPSQTFDAPPLEQPRPSMVDQLVANIFGDPVPGMASSSRTSFTRTTIMPTYFDSSLYTSQGLIELHLMTTLLQMITISRGC